MFACHLLELSVVIYVTFPPTHPCLLLPADDTDVLTAGPPCPRDELTRKPVACSASTMDGSSKGELRWGFISLVRVLACASIAACSSPVIRASGIYTVDICQLLMEEAGVATTLSNGSSGI